MTAGHVDGETYDVIVAGYGGAGATAAMAAHDAGARVLVIFIWLISVAAMVALWLRGSLRFPRLPGQGSLARGTRTRARAGSHSRRGHA